MHLNVVVRRVEVAEPAPRVLPITGARSPITPDAPAGDRVTRGVGVTVTGAPAPDEAAPVARDEVRGKSQPARAKSEAPKTAPAKTGGRRIGVAQRAEARKTLLAGAHQIKDAYALAYSEWIKNPKDPAALAALDTARQNARASFTELQQHLESLPPKSNEHARFLKELETLSADYKGLEAGAELEPLAGETFLKNIREDKLLNKRLGLASKWLDVELDQGDLDHYIFTGLTTPALKAAFDKADRTGDAVHSGIMIDAKNARAAYLQHVGRAGEAEVLGGEVKTFTHARRDIQLDHADRQKKQAEKLAALPADKQTAATQTRAEKLFADAEATFKHIDEESRDALAGGKHKPGGLTARRAARATVGSADIQQNRSERQRVVDETSHAAYMERALATIKEVKAQGGAPREDPLLLGRPDALARDERQAAELAADAMKRQPAGVRGVEAQYNEAEYLDPSLKNDPAHRQKRRDVIKARIDNTEKRQASRAAGSWTPELAEKAHDAYVPSLLKDNAELETRATEDLAALQAKNPIGVRTAEEQGQVEAAIADRQLATDNLAGQRQVVERTQALKTSFDAGVGHAEQDLVDWQAKKEAFDKQQKQAYSARLLEHAVKYAGSVPGFRPDPPPEWTTEELVQRSELNTEKRTLETNLAEAKSRQTKTARAIAKYDQMWTENVGPGVIPTANALYEQQAALSGKITAEIQSPDFKTNKNIDAAGKKRIEQQRYGAEAELRAKKAAVKKEGATNLKLEADGARELGKVERRRWMVHYSKEQEIDSKAMDRTWSRLDDLAAAEERLAKLEGRKPRPVSATVTYTTGEQALLTTYRAQYKPHLDAMKAHNLAANGYLQRSETENSAIVAGDYAAAVSFAEKSETARADYVKLETKQARAEGRPIDHHELDRAALDSSRTFAAVSGAGAAIAPKASTNMLKRAKKVVDEALPILAKGTKEEKAARLTKRAHASDLLGVIADANRTAIAAPPRGANTWQERANAWVELTELGLDTGQAVIGDLSAKETLLGKLPAGEQEMVKNAATRVVKLDLLKNGTPSFYDVSIAGRKAAGDGLAGYIRYAEQLEEAMVARIRAASGGLIGRAWTIVADNTVNVLDGGAGRDVIGDSIDVTREQYENSKDGGRYKFGQFAGLFGMHDQAAGKDYQTRVEYMFWLADPAADDPRLRKSWMSEGKNRFAVEKKLIAENGFDDAANAWIHNDPARKAWINNHAADDHAALAELYKQPGAGDGMFGSNYEALNAKNRVLSNNLKKIEDNWVIKGAYMGAQIYTMYLVGKFGGRFMTRVPGLSHLDKLIKAGTGRLAGVVGAPAATWIAGAAEAYGMIRMSDAALNHAVKNWGIKPGSYEYDALNILFGGLTLSAQLNIARTNKTFVKEFGLVVGMQVGPMALAKVLDLSPDQEAWLSKWTGVFLPATIGAIGARAAKQNAPQHAELMARRAGAGEHVDAVKKIMTSDELLGRYDKIDGPKDLAARSRHVENELIRAKVEPETAKRIAMQDARQNARRLLPPADYDKLPVDQRARYDEQVDAKLGKAGFDREEIALGRAPLPSAEQGAAVARVFNGSELASKHGRIDAAADIEARHKFIEAKLVAEKVSPVEARRLADIDALEMAKKLVPLPTGTERQTGYYDQLVETMIAAKIPRERARAVAEVEAQAMLRQAQITAEAELAKQRATEGEGTNAASPARALDAIIAGQPNPRGHAETVNGRFDVMSGELVGGTMHAPDTRRMRGPEPILDAPDRATVLAARQELATVRPGQKITDRAAETLLEDTVHAARTTLLVEHEHQPARQELIPFSCEQMAGWCGFGQALTSTRLQELGIAADKLHALQARNVFRQPHDGADSMAFNHAFLIAEMPNGKLYLVDATFRQFFAGSTTPTGQGRPGDLMRRTERGSQIADELLRRGFIELTPEVANEYGRALSGDANSKKFTVEDYKKAQTIPLDYTRDDLDTLPPPPQMAPPKSASAGRTLALDADELTHAGPGELKQTRFQGGGHGYDNIAALEANGYRRSPKEAVLAYGNALSDWQQKKEAKRQFENGTIKDKPPPVGKKPTPGDFGLSGEKFYFVEKNGNAWLGGVYPTPNRIHRDGHTWFPKEWSEAHLQEAAALLGREGPNITRTDDGPRSKLSAWMRLDAEGRVELAPAKQTTAPSGQGWLKVSMIVPADITAGRTVFPEMKQQ